ncbi:hypothetical protein BX666DRAFT_2112010 [Dichotomocladium elegans]|nr:hypothetical protein BX666DRAFT_2112010 [Dichotomocladium elegans]
MQVAGTIDTTITASPTSTAVVAATTEESQSTTTKTTAATSLIAYNPAYASTTTLLPGNIANFITAVSLAARLSLRCSSLFMEALFEAAKYSTVFSFGLSRQALVAAISTAKKIHALTSPTSSANESDPSVDVENNLRPSHTHTCTHLSTFSFPPHPPTTQAAEESVQIIDGIFGSNETSRAIASIVSLVHHELMKDPEFELANQGKMAILGGLTKAMTAFAILQNVTHKRTMDEVVKVSLMWKGLVVEETYDRDIVAEEDEHPTDVIHELEEILASNDNNDSTLSLALQENHWKYPMYEITTTTQRLTTQTTRIQPIAADGSKPKAKYIVVNQDEEDQESFVAVIDHEDQNLPGAWIEHPVEDKTAIVSSESISSPFTRIKPTSKGLKIMLSAVSKKFSRKKVERQVRHEDLVGRSLAQHESIESLDLGSGEEDGRHPCLHDEPVVTTIETSTSTTLRSTSAQYNSGDDRPSPVVKPLPSPPSSSSKTTNSIQSSGERAVKRRSSLGRLKLKGSRRKSITSLFQKGTEALKKQQERSPAPPVPDRHGNSQFNSSTTSSSMAVASRTSISGTHRGRSNSITSISSVAQTLTTTTTYMTNPNSPSTSSTMNSQQKHKGKSDRLASSSGSSQLVERRLVRSPSVPNSRKKYKMRSPLETEPDPRNFPRNHILKNIEHFMRYASAAYGESFMRILKIGDIPSVLPDSHHPNHHAFAHHTGVSVDDILLSSYTDTTLFSAMKHQQLHALVHYVTVDHMTQSVVLTCRGTLGLSDVLTDLMCDYAEFEHNGTTYTAHGGMLEAAQLLAAQKGKVYDAIMSGLMANPSYGLVLCGHSLGAGVASLLSVLWSEERQANIQAEPHALAALALARDPVPFVTSRQSGLPSGRPIHCYTYGPPCVMSLELSEYCGRGLVTSIVHGYDIVPSLSLGLLKDFKNVAVSLSQESSVADDIISRVIGRYRKNDENSNSNDDHDQWFWALIKTMRADMGADKLYPPSTVYLVESTAQFVQQHTSGGLKKKHKRAHNIVFHKCEDVQTRFSEIVFSRTMFMDHAPNMYENAIHNLTQGFFRTPTQCKDNPELGRTDYFFSFTENAYEVSIVANQRVIECDVLPHLSMFPDIKTSPDVFRVFQVDDPNGQDASGKRISDLSEPLARGKFSIFYMSTYQTDFVLIKERRVREAAEALMNHGFTFDQDSLEGFLATGPLLPARSPPISQEPDDEYFESDVLPTELQCAGLNPHHQSAWAMTMLKIISYPDLLKNRSRDEARFFSYTATADGISLLADKDILDLFDEDALFRDPASLRVIQVNLSGTDLDRCGIVRSISHPLAAGAHINLMYQSTATSANIIVKLFVFSYWAGYLHTVANNLYRSLLKILIVQ